MEHAVSWEPPDEGWIMLQTDGAAKGCPGLAGAGGVFRDAQGRWMVGFAEYLGRCSAVKAELKAVFRGLRMAREMNFHKLWIRLDSKPVVELLSSCGSGNSECHALIHQSKQLLSWSGWEIKISHCFREANQVADKLANLGAQEGFGLQVFQVPPRETYDALLADCMGIAWPRRTRT